ncbi:DUF11 domain-containing protein [Polaribacter ponticola]|uniref:DUF11 domain-containing protein n=1 Tax=Polaribacter ponticola TaxID=2978475 RepID=A0ABT5SC08_9FLAO|nr:DUF11 domain-containing protein [Polaribacter sp. MSW5]MDD7915656.1 DUF11 domain-containing protein [Polaribacter sp. MSW5]
MYGQLDSEHFLPPLKQVSNNAAIKQQAVYFSTPETTAFSIEIYRGSSLTPAVTLTGLEKGNPLILDSSNATFPLSDGDNNITLVTNTNTGVVLNNAGLRIVAPGGQKFYVNYRGRSNSQAGSLTSKGEKAKGLNFRWGGIPNLARSNNAGTLISTSLGMMATEDGTIVRVFGFNPGCKFRLQGARGGMPLSTLNSISLDKGESFVIEANVKETDANRDGWLGSSITSNKPIVISNGGLNVGIRDGSASRDVGIDQPVGLAALGREYVFVRGTGINGDVSLNRIGTEFPIIVATADGTEVFAGGVSQGIINNGDYKIIDGSNYSSNVPGASMYVTTSKDAYAYQCLQGAAGKIYTIGMNFIAPVNCLLPSLMDEISDIDKIAGSSTNISAVTIIASRATDPSNIIVNQTIGNTTTQIALPSPVYPAGTLDWQTFYIDGLEGEIDIVSTGNIAIGTFMSLGTAAGVAGYFSGFDTIPVVEVEISDGGCYPRTSLQEATGGFDAYQWYQDGVAISGETNQKLLLINASTGKDLGLGDFYVKVTKGTCSYDSGVVSIYNCDPDIVLTKIADENNLTDEDTVTFKVQVESSGIDPVSNLVINDAFPGELDLVSVTPSFGTWLSPNWTIGAMNSGQVHTLIIEAKVPQKPSEGTFTNTVTNSQDQVDSNQTTDDPIENVTITAKKIDLNLVKTVDKQVVKLGDTVIFTLILKNSGPTAASGVQVKDVLPLGLTYSLGDSVIPLNTTYDPVSGIWDLSGILISNGSSIVLEIGAKVDSVNFKLNKTEVYKTEQLDLDSVPGNDN